MQSDIKNKVHPGVSPRLYHRVYLLDQSFDELQNFVSNLGLEKFRARQIFRGIYVDNLSDFAHLTTIPLKLRRELDQSVSLRSFKLAASTTSALDGTVKFLVLFFD